MKIINMPIHSILRIVTLAGMREWKGFKEEVSLGVSIIFSSKKRTD